MAAELESSTPSCSIRRAPERGADGASLQEPKVSRMVYGSCDPGSFARDARTLQDGGYRLEKMLPIDQFLWSPHVELIALFAARR